MPHSVINALTQTAKNAVSHARFHLTVQDCPDFLDVLSFESEEALSQPWRYEVTVTCTNGHINPEQILLRSGAFTYQVPLLSGFPNKSIRTVYGVVCEFKHLKTSADETRYSLILVPRITLLQYTKRSEVYLNQSVTEVVEKVLRRHGLEGADFEFQLSREYPVRELITQWRETDLAFIQRLLAEVGIYWRMEMDTKLEMDKVIFHDAQENYQFGISLPYRHESGMSDSGQDSVWGLQISHQVVSEGVVTRDYNYRQALTPQDSAEVISGFEEVTTGEVYHYAEPFLNVGDIDTPESGAFYAHLRHERILNAQSWVSGYSTSPILAPGQVLEMTGVFPHLVKDGVLITHVHHRGARDTSLQVQFSGQRYREAFCFRPPLLPRPIIAGTLPARVESSEKGDTYAWLDEFGRYRVKLDFDREQSEEGFAYLWLRLAKPYAGDTYGWHMPLLEGTEVSVQFDGGDPDRPYIAYAQHDSEHPDLVTRDNHTRNVLRTPANNKLRMEDKRQEEHIKLATEYGKTQLNLGHLVNAQREQRGAGFELRTDEHGAIRAGKGMFISADEQPKAQGNMLDMEKAVKQIQHANQQMQTLSQTAEKANALTADIQSQIEFLDSRLQQLQSAVLLASAPQGIALTSGEHLQLSSQGNTMVNAGQHLDIGAMQNLSVAVEKELGLFAHKEEVKIIANQGAVEISAQHNTMDLFAQQQITITSSEDEIVISTPKTLTLNGGGSYLKLSEQGIEHGSSGDYIMKTANYVVPGSGADMACETKEFDVTEIELQKQVISRALHD
ncbi:type VI secretion system tip protein VgrG [Proteus mirabilis]|uniref:type VI secretion system Vgr family protein n=1 Tax=Proteus mirabilis TaxID=584 RepID=UPI00235FDD30|nr:type VI secretion system Vgr family protein [Proteus mirabilis]MDC9742721.1 type VI secretion system tip protein VgrG [Proteus mirabilis]